MIRSACYYTMFYQNFIPQTDFFYCSGLSSLVTPKEHPSQLFRPSQKTTQNDTSSVMPGNRALYQASKVFKYLWIPLIETFRNER